MSPTTDSYPWEQLSLLEPDLMRVQFAVTVCALDDTLVANVQLRSGTELHLEGAQTFGGGASQIELDEILAELRRWCEGALNRVCPFPR